MDIYARLGVPKGINAAGTYTAIGGSTMSDGTRQAMAEASRSYVAIGQLQQAVHSRLAEITNNEAAFICNGAACGLYLTAAAAVARLYQRPFETLSWDDIHRAEIVLFRAHRNPYDWALRQLGITLREVGYPNLLSSPSAAELRQAIGPQTAAIFYVAGSPQGWMARGGLPLAEAIAVAAERSTPLIVDGAAQLPPVDNLWRYTTMGATAALFSGGKDLRGPQSSGLIIGRRMLLEEVTRLGFPHYGIGRMLKVGREEMVGLFNAVEEYLDLDHTQRAEWCEAQVALLQEQLAATSIYRVERLYPNEASQPLPLARLQLSDRGPGWRLVCPSPRRRHPIDIHHAP